jgi:hypothetical protein
LQNSRWGDVAKFPQRQNPAAIEGSIVHTALDLLARAVAVVGRPAVGTLEFASAAEECGFWTFFAAEIVSGTQRP